MTDLAKRLSKVLGIPVIDGVAVAMAMLHGLALLRPQEKLLVGASTCV